MKHRIVSLPVRLLLAVLLLMPLVFLATAEPILAQETTGTPHATPPTPASSTSAVTTIALGDEIAIDGAGAALSDQGVTIAAAGAYRLSGTLADGMIDVTAPDAVVELVLAGASITNADGPAILIRDAAEAIVTLEPDTTNALADGGESDFDAALFSNASLTFRGEGALTVDGHQNEGIASTWHITIESGEIWVRAVEDGLNANQDDVSEIAINGGYLAIVTETGDGIDSNGVLTITGGTVITLGAMADMNGGLDADGPVTIDGGTVIATGARLSMPVAASAQAALVVTFDAPQAANTLVVIRDEAGEDILAFAPSIAYKQLLYSNVGLVDGAIYTVYAGGEAEGEAVDGLFSAPAANPGTEVTTITTESVEEARMRRPGGPPPGEGGSPPAGPPLEDHAPANDRSPILRCGPDSEPATRCPCEFARIDEGGLCLRPPVRFPRATAA